MEEPPSGGFFFLCNRVCYAGFGTKRTDRVGSGDVCSWGKAEVGF